jgi:outer membrane receptor protein involved in Fe transport
MQAADAQVSEPLAQATQTSPQDTQTTAEATQTTTLASGMTEQVPGLQPIVVTGTRVARNGYQAPTPVTVLNLEDLERDAPINIADSINKLPELSNSPSSHNSGASVSDANGGVNNLNLRSLGPNRTLVLLDGVRVAPASITGFYGNGGAVDINAFPDNLISRVDIVTGGASADYGSDALAGIVNFILDKDFTGVKGNATYGETTYGDDRQYALSLAAGTGFAGGRGHLLLSAEDNYDEGIPNAGRARPWVRDYPGIIGNPAYTPDNGQPYFIIRNHVGSALYTPGGLVSSGPLAGLDFGPRGSPGQFMFGSPSDGFAMVGGDWQEAPDAANPASLNGNTSLDDRTSRQNLFGRVSYALTDYSQVYVQLDYARTTTTGYGTVSEGNDITITQDNPFLQPAVLAQMQAAGVSSFTLNTYNTDLGVAGSHNIRQFNQYLVGSNGKFTTLGTRWSWDAHATRSITRIDANTINNENTGNLALATDVVVSPTTGLAICRSTLTDPTNGCVPYNPMGIGVNTQAALDYVGGNGHLQQDIALDEASATMHGEPLSSWAGPVSLAFGVEHSRYSVESSTTAADDSNSFYVGNYKATEGAYRVSEGFAETVVPLAKNQSWAKSLDLNAAVRETDYSTSGRVTTWKGGVTWAPINDIRFRATRSRDIRSPNLGELFNSGQAGTGTVIDPFEGNKVVPEINITVGNAALAPEVADTTAVGFVVQPRLMPGFGASFDYYHIAINNAIADLNEQDELDQCFGGNNVYCSYINRDAAGNLSVIYLKPSNTGGTTTKGLDVEASYVRLLSDMRANWDGTFTARFLATRVFDLTTISPTGIAEQGAGVYSGNLDTPLVAPKFSYSVTLGYDIRNLSVSWTGRGISDGVLDSRYTQCTSGCPAAVPPFYTIDNNQLPSAFYMDLSLNYEMHKKEASKLDLYLTVQNLTDRQPKGVFFYGFIPGVYDTIGRTIRTGVRFKF